MGVLPSDSRQAIAGSPGSLGELAMDDSLIDGVTPSPIEPSLPNSNLRQAGKSIQWKVIGSVAERVLNLLSVSIMARLVTPSDVGLVSIATIGFGLVGMMRDLGLSEAIIRAQEATPRFLNTCFWVRMGVGLALYALLAIVAAPFAWAYQQPILLPMLLVMGTTYMLDALPTVQEAILIREFRLGPATLARVGSLLLGLLVAIWAAWSGWGAWALIVNAVAATGFSILFLAPFTHWWPGVSINRKDVPHLIHFGGALTLTQLFGWFTESFGTAVLGLVASTDRVGIFRFASVIGRWPDSLLGSIMGRGLAVSFFAKVQGDPESMRIALIRATNVLYLFGMTLSALILVLGKPLVLVVYGQRWENAVPFAQLIVIGGTALMIRQTLRYWLIASGHSGTLSRNQFFTAVVAVPMILLGAWYGLLGVTIATTLACIVESVLLWIGNRDRTKLPRGGWIVAFWRPIAVSLMVGASLLVFNQLFPTWGEPFFRSIANLTLAPLLTPKAFDLFLTGFIPFSHLGAGMMLAGLIWLAAAYSLMPGEMDFLKRMLGIRWPRSKNV